MNGYTFERRELKYRITDAPALRTHPSKQPTAAAENRCGCSLSKKPRRVRARRHK